MSDQFGSFVGYRICGLRVPYLALIFSVLTTLTSAQNILLKYDSIPVVKAKATRDIYGFDHQDLNEITVMNGSPKPVSPDLNFKDKLSNNVLTIFTGINSSSWQEGVWVTENELRTNQTSLNWNIHIYFSGTFYKKRERVKTSDGSYTIASEDSLYPDWMAGGFGIILEDKDTIGVFSLMINIPMSSPLKSWMLKLRKDGSNDYEKIRKYEQLQSNTDFAIEGTFRNRNFSMLTSGSHYRSLVAFENNPNLIFQNHPDFIILSKKDKVHPYLLMNNDKDGLEIVDLLQLSILNVLIKNSVGNDYYAL